MKQFKREYNTFSKLSTKTINRFAENGISLYPCLNDNTGTTSFDSHYVYHLAWATRVLKEIAPKKHIDISSFVYFSTMLSAFIPVEFFDYRPANIKLPNLKTGKSNLTDLNFESNSINSLSCMHTVEHIGLGRYGDNLDYDGDIKAIEELKRVLTPNGDLLFVVPLGKPKIAFNAHRIYSYSQIIEYFSDFKVMNFTLIPDNADQIGIIENATIDLCNQQNYGCGCFWFKK